jgi:hypothetical protein
MSNIQYFKLIKYTYSNQFDLSLSIVNILFYLNIKIDYQTITIEIQVLNNEGFAVKKLYYTNLLIHYCHFANTSLSQILLLSLYASQKVGKNMKYIKDKNN